MKELKPGDKVKVWGPSIPQAWFSGQEVELVAHGGGIGFWENGTLYCVHERQVEKIEPEKCPGRDPLFDTPCSRNPFHDGSHVGILPSEPAPKPEVKIGDQVIARGFFADVVEPFKAVTSDDYRMRILGIERWRGIETFLRSNPVFIRARERTRRRTRSHCRPHQGHP